MTTQNKTIKKDINYYVNELDFLREDLNKFIESGFFEITEQGEYLFFGVKKGYLKALKEKGYKQKQILTYLNLIEYGLNNGLVCHKCLSIGVYSVDEVNVFNSYCNKCKWGLI